MFTIFFSIETRSPQFRFILYFFVFAWSWKLQLLCLSFLDDNKSDIY